MYCIVSSFVDSISKKLFCEFQHSTSAGKTIVSKHNMDRECKQSAIKIQFFRGDNGIYSASEFGTDLKNKDQYLTFCCVGAYHQNGVAEKYIRTMVGKSRTALLNAHERCPNFIEIELWTFAFCRVVNQWTNTPRFDLAYKTPDERFNCLKRQTDAKSHFKTLYPFGCPVYVLNGKLRDKQSQPKRLPRSRVGVDLEKARQYAKYVSYIINLKTGNISPQYIMIMMVNSSH